VENATAGHQDVALAAAADPVRRQGACQSAHPDAAGRDAAECLRDGQQAFGQPERHRDEVQRELLDERQQEKLELRLLDAAPLARQVEQARQPALQDESESPASAQLLEQAQEDERQPERLDVAQQARRAWPEQPSVSLAPRLREAQRLAVLPDGQREARPELRVAREPPALPPGRQRQAAEQPSAQRVAGQA
jgi:hypothetical protein